MASRTREAVSRFFALGGANFTMTKPRVSTIIALGYALPPKFEGKKMMNVIWGQTRGFYRPDGSKLTGSPGERSIFGEHCKEGESSLDAAIRCAHQEFWCNEAIPIREDHLELLAEGVQTEKTINDVFLLNFVCEEAAMSIGEGDGLLRIPLYQVPWYMRDGHLTEASITCLSGVPPLEDLFGRLKKKYY